MPSPIELILEVMKPEEIAEICGVDRTTVCYWRDSIMRGKGVGFIPSAYIPRLYAHIQANKLGISLERLTGVPPRKR